MLIKRRVLDGVASGTLDLAFRRWERARVKPGTRLRTAIGVLEVKDVESVSARAIGERDAQRAGFASKQELISELDSRAGIIYRIVLRHAGEDPRIALRKNTRFDDGEREMLVEKLDKMDRASPHGPWTRKVLRLILERPAVRAPDLAASLGRETKSFKIDVRKLKEFGFTESLKVGYRLSPRGKAFLRFDDGKRSGSVASKAARVSKARKRAASHKK